MNKKVKKMNSEQLQGLLTFRHKGSTVAPKKGKGSYNRKPKYKKMEVD